MEVKLALELREAERDRFPIVMRYIFTGFFPSFSRKFKGLLYLHGELTTSSLTDMIYVVIWFF